MNRKRIQDVGATAEWTRFESPSAAVVAAVAEAADTDPTNTEPLYSTIDPDSLDSLFTPTNATRDTPQRVQFEYNDYEVVVDGNGGVYVYD